jgi:hypothetical protein
MRGSLIVGACSFILGSGEKIPLDIAATKVKLMQLRLI